MELGRNKISDINILEKIDFKKLRVLDLSGNKISNINILEKVDFKELERLNLKDNDELDKNSSIITYLKSKIEYLSI